MRVVCLDSCELLWRIVAGASFALALGCTRVDEAVVGEPSSGAGNIGTNSAEASADLATKSAPKTLAEAEAMARRAFEEFLDIDELIYPKGWVKRRTPVLESSHESFASADAKGDQTGPASGIVRIKFQEHSSVVHVTEAAAAADEELFPCPPAATRTDMERAQSEQPFDPVVVEIHYEAFDDRVRRKAWSTTPKITRGATWLDRLGVP